MGNFNRMPVMGANVLSTLTFHASVTSGGSTIVIPATVLPGDLIVLVDNLISKDPITQITPTGFTLINFTGSGGSPYPSEYRHSRKIAAPGDAGATVTGMAGTGILVRQKLMLVFRGNIPITAAVVFGLGVQLTVNDPTAQVKLASAQPVPLVLLAQYFGDTNIAVRSFTPAKDGEIGATFSWFAYKIYNSAPADTTVDMVDVGDENVLFSYGLRCS